MIAMGRDLAAGDGRSAAALDRQRVAGAFGVDAAGVEAGDDRLDPVAFLDPQFAEAVEDAGALRRQAAATARIGYSSIIDGDRDAGT